MGKPTSLLAKITHSEIGRRFGNSNGTVSSHFVPNQHTNTLSAPHYIRTFSNDGKYAICFSFDLRDVLVYQFLGPTPSTDLPYSWEDFFELKYTRNLASTGRTRGVLSKDFCLLSEDGEYVILAGTSYSNDENEDDFEFPSMSTPNPGSLPIKLEQNEFDFHFYVLRLSTGEVTDHLRFSRDFIRLKNHDGVFLYKQKLAVLSILNQTIHMFELQQNGTMIKMQDIGWFCNDSDEITFLIAREAEITHGVQPKDADMDSFISQEPSWILSGLKERILTRMYKDCLENANRRTALSLFYKKFEKLASLILWKFQILDDDHLLLKMNTDENIGNDCCLLVVYNISTTEVISVTTNTSREIIKIFETQCSRFKTCSNIKGRTRSISDDYYRRRNHRIQLNNVQYIRQFLKLAMKQIPFSSQVWNESVYLDTDIFTYDHAKINSSVSEQEYSPTPIHFYDRETNEHLFSIHSPEVNEEDGSSLCSYLFHPFYPFVISMRGRNMVLHYHTTL